jgi:4-alpha-glucanotransferase
MKGTTTLRSRSSGILMHLSSLPSLHGIGDLGPAAYRFVDFLASCKQSWWQMLPISPVGRENSPYDSPSAFAGNPMFISLEELAARGLLTQDDISPPKDLSKRKVDYSGVIRYKLPRLTKTFENFEKRSGSSDYFRFEEYCTTNGSWLVNHGIFSALKERNGGAPWTEWDEGIRTRRPSALTQVKRQLKTQIRYHMFLQYEFSGQWAELRRYCAKRGVGLIGDIPFYVAHDSADVWANQQIFQLDRHGRPTHVAGVPPDYFSETGQLWGNPLYRWDVLRRRGYYWWIDRLRVTFSRFDAVRLDHFIGFQRYWEVPANARTSRRGRWVKGPRRHFFDTAFRMLGRKEFIAEDLGVVTLDVKQLRDRLGLPGMRVLQFAFGKDPDVMSHRPHNYPRDCIVYTGTHDNDTTLGWYTDKGSAASTRSKQDIEMELGYALRYLNSNGKQISWDMIRLAMMSVANVAITPVQDILELGSEARMNIPGKAKGNWEWRLTEDALDKHVAERLLDLTETYERVLPEANARHLSWRAMK